MQPNPKPAPQQGMETPPNLDSVYVNLVRISHSPAEIVLDFGRILPVQAGPPSVLSRLVMSPVGAKLFLRALNENLARYEAAFGEIPLPRDSSLANDLFRAVQPPDGPKQE